ncbi:MAG: transglutaminase family protein [bacterium]|nr:transglutaminase family protein [bacterium]
MLSEYLEKTRYCDCQNPEIKAKARELEGKDETKTAVNVWKFISYVPYRFDFWNVKASETLDKRYGMCTNKANLQIAILRAAGIPAAYGTMKIRKSALLDVSSPDFYEKISPVTTHIFAYVYLNGEWIATDATRDRTLEGDVPHDPLDNRAYPWDGKTNYKKSPNFVISEGKMSANIDKKLEIKPRFITPEVLERINTHIDNMQERRSHESKHNEKESAHHCG